MDSFELIKTRYLPICIAFTTFIILLNAIILFTFKCTSSNNLNTLTALENTHTSIAFGDIPKNVPCDLNIVTLPRLPTNLLPLQFSTLLTDRVSFANDFNKNIIDGWCGATNAYLAALLSKFQHTNGIYGSVGEIGVHHGKFFISLAHTTSALPVKEKLFVCDVFSLQHLNIDKSGKGDKTLFINNAEKYGIKSNDINIYEGSSLDLNITLLSELNSELIPFRIFSVDGGHTFEAALSDVRLSSCIVVDGGIVIVDDIYHSKSIPDAMDAIYKLELCPRLKPFLVLDNKLWYTTTSHQELYMNFSLNVFTKILKEDADLNPQMIYAPQLMPPVFGSNVPIIAYLSTNYEVDSGQLYDRIIKRWVDFLSYAG